jgi:hypothetical protein
MTFSPNPNVQTNVVGQPYAYSPLSDDYLIQVGDEDIQVHTICDDRDDADHSMDDDGDDNDNDNTDDDSSTNNNMDDSNMDDASNNNCMNMDTNSHGNNDNYMDNNHILPTNMVLQCETKHPTLDRKKSLNDVNSNNRRRRIQWQLPSMLR